MTSDVPRPAQGGRREQEGACNASGQLLLPLLDAPYQKTATHPKNGLRFASCLHAV